MKDPTLLPRCQQAFAKAAAYYRTFFDVSGPTKATMGMAVGTVISAGSINGNSRL